MKLRCVIGLHAWADCKCSRCGKTRDEGHDWSADCEQCVKCGKTRRGEHSWSRCKCSRCGKTRDEGHDWSADCEQCVKCGKTRRGEHIWSWCKCSRCGKTRDEAHYWGGDTAEEKITTLVKAFAYAGTLMGEGLNVSPARIACLVVEGEQAAIQLGCSKQRFRALVNACNTSGAISSVEQFLQSGDVHAPAMRVIQEAETIIAELKTRKAVLVVEADALKDEVLMGLEQFERLTLAASLCGHAVALGMSSPVAEAARSAVESRCADAADKRSIVLRALQLLLSEYAPLQDGNKAIVLKAIALLEAAVPKAKATLDARITCPQCGTSMIYTRSACPKCKRRMINLKE